LSQEVFLKTLITPYVCCFPTQWLLNEENKKQLWLQGDPELLPQAFQSTTAATANQFNPSKSMQKRRETKKTLVIFPSISKQWILKESRI